MTGSGANAGCARVAGRRARHATRPGAGVPSWRSSSAGCSRRRRSRPGRARSARGPPGAGACAPCWNPTPPGMPVMADGTYLRGGGCLLVAIDGPSGEVIAWRWCARESTDEYIALFSRIPAPDVLVCDGLRGIGNACRRAWPGTRMQRCLVHVQRDSRRDLTSRPRLQAGRELKRLADTITGIHDTEQAAAWAVQLHEWRNRWRDTLAERTYARDAPGDPAPPDRNGGGRTSPCDVATAGWNRCSDRGPCSRSSTPRSYPPAPCRAPPTASRAGSTRRSNACSSITAAFPDGTASSHANGHAT